MGFTLGTSHQKLLLYKEQITPAHFDNIQVKLMQTNQCLYLEMKRESQKNFGKKNYGYLK